MFTHRNVSWTVEQSGYIFSVTIASFPVLDSAIGNGFLHASVGFRQIIHTSHAEILYANIRQWPKQQQNSVHLPLSRSISEVLGYPALFT